MSGRKGDVMITLVLILGRYVVRLGGGQNWLRIMSFASISSGELSSVATLSVIC